ncbi:MAG: hypothetical protein EB127_18975 [Alphaproteobacteria bacterium]|nr:hypothetical protein [Alphaproteobacteria bacterium]
MGLDTKTEFLKKFIEISSEIGINEAALHSSSQKIYNHPQGYVADFYLGIPDIVKSIEEMYDANLASVVEISVVNSITEKIRIALYYRITSQSPEFAYKLHKYYKTMKGIQIFPTVKFKTCNFIWQLAGDKSLDFNYYSKRMLLFAVYIASSRKYAISKNIEETERSINEGLEKVLKISKLRPSLILEKIPFIRLLIK